VNIDVDIVKGNQMIGTLQEKLAALKADKTTMDTTVAEGIVFISAWGWC
jgi:hypothetical protein